MNKKELFERIRGQMIVSCQALPGEPLYVEETSVMYLMARAAKMAGSPAIRTSGIRDVAAIKEETGLPVIGLVKIQYPGFDGYITPTMKEVDQLVEAGSDVVAWIARTAGGEMGAPQENLYRQSVKNTRISY